MKFKIGDLVKCDCHGINLGLITEVVNYKRFLVYEFVTTYSYYCSELHLVKL